MGSEVTEESTMARCLRLAISLTLVPSSGLYILFWLNFVCVNHSDGLDCLYR